MIFKGKKRVTFTELNLLELFIFQWLKSAELLVRKSLRAAGGDLVNSKCQIT